ncbi:MAG TPA: hypothetical protein VHB51_03395 [Candidatus Saccharimonadales bacterium]|nr:hypothetical protein [Candidatus Saccharimonadales bacterium]
MHHQQSVTNLVAKAASAAELSKWRDAQVDPELLCRPTPSEPRNYEQAHRPIGFQVGEAAVRKTGEEQDVIRRYAGGTVSRAAEIWETNPFGQ